MNEQEKADVQKAGAASERPVDRRDMLKAGALGALGVLTHHAGAAEALTGGGSAGGQKRFAMVIDLRKCIGCHACSVACKSENRVPLGVWRSWVKQVERGEFPNTQRHFLPRLCNHCDRPACVDACPTKSSYQREDGIVLIREERCVGCKLCMAACPYNARYLDPVTKTSAKCTFCAHRVDKGVVPACVNTCQGRARIFGDLNDRASEVARLVAREAVQAIKTELGTEPRVFYIGADMGVMGHAGKEV